MVIGVGVPLQNNMRLGHAEELSGVLTILHAHRAGKFARHTEQIVVAEAHNLDGELLLNDRSIFSREEDTLRFLTANLSGARSKSKESQNRGTSGTFLIHIPAATAIFGRAGTKSGAQESLTGAFVTAGSGVLCVNVHT